LAISSVSSFFKFISEPDSLLLEDPRSETRSKEHDQTVFLFVKPVRSKINGCNDVYVALNICQKVSVVEHGFALN